MDAHDNARVLKEIRGLRELIEAKPFEPRLTVRLWQQVERSAQDRNISMDAEIIRRLEQSYRDA